MYKTDEVFKFLVKQMKHPKADRSFLNEKYTNHSQWYEETCEWLKSRTLYDLEPNPEGHAPVYTQEQDFGGHVRKKLYFYTAKDCKVSAYLLVPKGLVAPAPAIVALHDHSGYYYYGKEKIVDHDPPIEAISNFQNWCYGGRGFASALAEKGYVVMVIDMLGWGERSWVKESWLGGGPSHFHGMEKGSAEYIDAYNNAWGSFGRRAVNTAFYAGMSLPGIQTWDDIRTIDFLCTLPEVDASRIGCLGLSVGGLRTVMLGALDTRIKCSCTAGYMPLSADQVPYRMGTTIPGVHDHLPFPDMAAMMAPRPMLVLNCENDVLFDLTSMEDSAETIRKVYRKVGAEDMFAAEFFPVGHMFNYEMQERAFEWLDKHLCK